MNCEHNFKFKYCVTQIEHAFSHNIRSNEGHAELNTWVCWQRPLA